MRTRFNVILIVKLIAIVIYTSYANEDDKIRNFQFENTRDSIVDSIRADENLDGYILFSQNNQDFTIHIATTGLHAGDTGINTMVVDPNSVTRSYLSFLLPEIPAGYEMGNCYVRLYQYDSIGQGVDDTFPEWNVAGGDTMFVIMDHIDYGYGLDENDWFCGDVGNENTLASNIGVLSNSPQEGFRFLDVSQYVLSDYAVGRIMSQYRVRFPIDTDWDNLHDNMAFFQSLNSPYDPKLFIEFENISSIWDIEIPSTDMIKAYPNPIVQENGERNNNRITFEFEIQKKQIVELVIYNLKGDLIKKLFKSEFDVGTHQYYWEIHNAPSGIYFCNLKTKNSNQTTKVLILK